MKKKIFLFCLFILVLCSFIFSQTKIISNAKLEKFIEPKLYTEKTVFQNVSKEQLLADFEAFEYFLSTSYIAYDEMVQKGFVLEDFAFNICNKITNDVIKSSDELIKNIYENLSNYICDSHFSIANKDSVYNFNPKFYEQNSSLSNDFKMIINKNSVYLSMPGLLPDYFMEKSFTKEFFKNVYTELNIIKEKKYLIIDLRNCPGGVTDYPVMLLYSLYEGRQSVIPSDIYDVREFVYETIFSRIKSVKTPVTEGLRYQNAIYTGNKKYEDDLRISSIMQSKNPKRIIWTDYSKSSQKIHKPEYKGKIIFLTNNRTASAAEILILFSKILFPKSIKVIGQNTMGCLTYIDVYQLMMPNNTFAVSMAFKSIEDSLKQFDCWKGEGQGIEPDVICADDEILPNLIKITKDKKLRL